MKRLILLILLFRLTDAIGQSPYFQQYFLLKKNDPVNVEVILKDRVGFMWIGTNKGLFRFDGINIRRFTTSDSLAADHVTALAQDSVGRLWIGHKNGLLSVLENDQIQKHSFPEGDATQEISDILFAHDGTMWFSTLNDGLYYFNEHLYRLDDADGMPDLFVYDLEESNDGRIWAGTDAGVAVCTLVDRKASIKVFDYKSGFPDNIIRKITAADNIMWFATEDAGVFSYDISSGKSKPLINTGWNGGAVVDFLKLDNEFWLATSSSDILVYNQADEQMNIYKPLAGVASTCLFADEEGSVWVGSRNGLFRSLGRDIRFIDDLSPAHDPNVAAITVDKKNDIWFANDEGLFRRMVNKDGKVDMQRHLTAAPFSKFKVISLYTDSQGFIWCGFYGQGAVRINPDNGSIQRIEKELTNGSILSISGSENKVWLSTLSGASLIDLSKGISVTNYDRSKGLDCDYVYQVFVDSKQRTWFASDREGVAMLDEKGFHKMLDNFSSRAVYGFAEDGTGVIWVNVQDDGLFRFDGNQFQPGQVLRNININCLSSDVSGNLVAVHDLGIEVYDPKTNSSYHLDNEIGFGDRKPNLNAAAKDIHGNLFFGTDHGIVVYGDTKRVNARPVARIDKFRIFNRYKDISDELTLTYDENNVTITFLGFWYQDPEGVGFQYKLENYDVDWIATADRSAVFSSLPPGRYTFRLRASANNNFEGAVEDTINFVIRPPFWKTAVFYVIVVIAFGFVVYTYFRRREKKLKEDNLILEEKVTERTIEITRKNEEIQTQAEEIKAINESLEKRVTERTFELEKKNKALADYAFINAHNLRAPVASILGLINLLARVEYDKEGKEIVDHMQVSAEKLDEVVRSITESIEQGDRLDAFKNKDDGID